MPWVCRMSQTVEAPMRWGEPGQFAVDSAVTPAGVLAGQP